LGQTVRQPNRQIRAANCSGGLPDLSSREVLEGMHLGSLAPEQEKSTKFSEFFLFK
jgi:hypothetical protein